MRLIVPNLCPCLLLLPFCSESFLLNSVLRFLQFQDRIIHIRAIHDCVALEDTPRTPAADLHDDAFGDSGPA